MNGHIGMTPLPDGTRVRHSAHEFSSAFLHGTGVVLRHFWRGRWLEYVVRIDSDKGLGEPLEREWSADCTIEHKP